MPPNSSSPSPSQWDSSFSEPLTVERLTAIHEQLLEQHPTIRARLAMEEFLRWPFPERLVVSTPAPWRDTSWYVRTAAWNSLSLTGANAIGERMMRESLISTTLLGDWSPTLPSKKASFLSRFISTARLRLHDLYFFLTRR